MNTAALLWRLQVTDQEIDDKTKRLQQVDDALSGDPAVSTCRLAFDSAQKQLADLRGTLRDRELQAESLDAKIREIEKRLYSGRVTNPKELDGLNKDLEMHRRNRSALDDQLLELMDTVEQAQARVNEKSNALKQAETKRTEDLEHLTRERECLTTNLAQLSSAREQMRALPGPDALRTYDRLRHIKAGRAVVPIKRDACGACGVTVPTGLINRVHTGDEIVFCPSCGRVLAA